MSEQLAYVCGIISGVMSSAIFYRMFLHHRKDDAFTCDLYTCGCGRSFRSAVGLIGHRDLCKLSPANIELANVADDLEEVAAGIRMHLGKAN